MKQFSLVLGTLITLFAMSIQAEEVQIEGVTYTYQGSSATVTACANNEDTLRIHDQIRVNNVAYTVIGIASDALSNASSSLRTLCFDSETLPTNMNVDFAETSISRRLCIIFKGIKYYHQGTWSDPNQYFSVGNGDGERNGFDEPSAPANRQLVIYPSINQCPVTDIQSAAFRYVSGYSLTIASSITNISETAFVSIQTPNTLTSITVDNDNTKYKSYGGVLYAKLDEGGYELVSCPKDISNNIDWLSGVKRIGNNAFLCHYNLSSITIPSTVTEIGQSAFQYAGKDIEEGLRVNFSNANSLKTIGRSAFQESAITEGNLPEGLTSIGERAFSNSKKLTGIYLPSTLTAIGGSAFNGCSNLTLLGFNENNPYASTTINTYAFYNCPLQESIELPEGITTIKSNAFNFSASYFDSRLRTLRLPASVSSIASDAVDINVIMQRKANIVFGGNKWQTYYSAIDLQLPEGMEAYTVTGVNGSEIQLTQLSYIHREKALLLHYEGDALQEDDWYSIPNNTTIAQDAGITFNTDLFKGSTTGINNFSSLAGDKYVLNGDAFVKSNQGVLPPFRCYITLNENNYSHLYFGNESNNDEGTTYIYKEGGETTAYNVNIGTAKLIQQGNVMKLTITPGASYYAEKENIAVYRNVNAGTARAPKIDRTTLELTAVTPDADPSQPTEYTFTPIAGSTYEVVTDFQKRTNFQTAGLNPKVNLAEHENYVYDGMAKTPEVQSVTYGENNSVVDPSDYSISYEHNINAGKGWVIITGKRKFMKDIHGEFDISQRNINLVKVEEISDATYTGTEITPEVLVSDSVEIDGEKRNIITAEEYSISIINNKDVGKGKVIITSLKKNYTGIKEIEFNIKAQELTAENIKNIPTQPYTGNAVEPELDITDNNGLKLVKDKDYTVTFTDNINAGTASAHITFMGNYTGEAQKDFQIEDLGDERTITLNFDSDNEWTTYYGAESLTLADGLEAYVVTGINGKELTIRQVEFIPRNTALLMKRNGTATGDFAVQTNSSASLPNDIIPNTTLFQGTTTNTDMADLGGVNFILVKNEFVQVTEGTLPANRAYIHFDEAPQGITALAINKGADEIIKTLEGKSSNYELGDVTVSANVTEGKKTITVKPTKEYYVKKDDITIVRNIKAQSARAPQLDGGSVEVAEKEIIDNEDGTTTYTFTFPYTEGYSYQTAVNFRKCINFTIKDYQPVVKLKEHEDYIYDGSEKKPEVESVTSNGQLVDASNYTVSYRNNIKPGGSRVVITGKRYYTGSIDNNQFFISQRSIHSAKIKEIPDTTYSGQAIKPEVIITDSVEIDGEKRNIITDEEYKLEFVDNVNAGKAKINIKSENINYTGMTNITFNILPKKLTAENVVIEDIPQQDYTGEELKPQLTIKDGVWLLEKDKDYTAVYTNNIDEGTATVTVTFKGNYTGTVTKEFQIKDPGYPREIELSFDNNNEWTTYYGAENLTLAEGLKAYIVTGINSKELEIQQVNFIPKNTALLLNREGTSTGKFNLKTCSGTKLPEDVTPNVTLFQGSTSEKDLSTLKGVNFILVNNEFVQVSEGTLPANRCYIHLDEAPEGVTALAIGKDVDDIILTLGGKTSANELGTVYISTTASDGKKTITVKPAKQYYVTADAISIVKSMKAPSARAPQLDGGTVEVAEKDIKDNEDGTTTYTFTFPYTNGYNYQTTVDFKKCANFLDKEYRPVVTLKEHEDYVYDGKEKKPEVEYVESYGKRVDASNYTVSYSDNINSGKGKIIITGKRYFTGQIANTEFNIGKRDLKLAKVEMIPDSTYTGVEIEPEVIITDIVTINGVKKDLITTDDYRISYNKNINAGTAEVNISNRSRNYSGYINTTFNILRKKLTAENIEPIPLQYYTGTEIKPNININDGNITLAEGTDYDVVFANNVDEGTATATITFKGNYQGTVQTTFEIKDRGDDRTVTLRFDNNNEWTTYYGSESLTLAEGLEAYVVTGANGKELETQQVTFIPKNTALILKRTNEATGDFAVKTHSSGKLPTDVVPDEKLFVGTLTNKNISNIEGFNFILINNEFVQATEGTLPANRCYIHFDTMPEGITAMTIGNADAIIRTAEGKPTTAAGTVAISTIASEGKKTITVNPSKEYYVTADDITIVRNIKAHTARAPQLDGGSVEVVEKEIIDNEDGTTTYTFTFPYAEGYSYQTTVDFKKCINFTIKEYQPVVTLKEHENYIYDGSEKKPEVASVTSNGQLVDASNYTVSYRNNIKPGGSRVVITGKRYYTGSIDNTSFSINQRDIRLVKVEVIADTTFTGQSIRPEVIVTDSVEIDGVKKNIISDEDFIITFQNNINAGIAKVNVIGQKRNYDGNTKTVTFNILPKKLNEDNVDNIEPQKYTGHEITPEIIVRDGYNLIDPEYYDVVYSNNIHEGKADVDITFKGNYTGAAHKQFEIVHEALPRDLNVKFGTNDEWATYYGDENLTIPSGLKAYVITGHKYNSSTLNVKEVNFLPMNVALLVQRTDMSRTSSFTCETLPASTKLQGVTPDADLFIGTLTGIDDLSKVEGVKFILTNDQFTQATGGELPANRCYLNYGAVAPQDVITILANYGDEDIIILEEGKKMDNAGTANLSFVQNGQRTLVVTPAESNYAEAANITIIRSVTANSARVAPTVDNNKVTVTAVNPSADPSKQTKYTFPFSKVYSYQIIIDFQKRINIQAVGNQPDIILKNSTFEYDGTAKEPEVEKILIRGQEVDPINYTVSYEDNINAGTAKVVITGKRYLTNNISKNFSISQRDFKNVVIEDIPDQSYTGAEIRPEVIVKDIILINDVESNIVTPNDYTITYSNNVAIGKAKVGIMPNKVNYNGGGREITFNIVPASGIQQVKADEAEGEWYDLNGKHLQHRPTQKGVYLFIDKNHKRTKVAVE